MARRSAPMRLVVPSARAARAEEDLLQRADRADLDPLAARQLGVVRLGPPVVAAAGRVGGAGEGGAEHDGVGAAGDGLDDVAAVAHAAVGDDVDVAAAGLVEVVAAGRGDVGDRAAPSGRGCRACVGWCAPRRRRSRRARRPHRCA